MLRNAVSRCVLIGRLKNGPTTANKHAISLIVKRHSSGHGHWWSYRRIPYDPALRWKEIMCEMMGGAMWWWIGWNMMHDWRHLLGEFVWPTLGNFSDEELGIPPDDYD